jgi:deaminated glutathione amidase
VRPFGVAGLQLHISGKESNLPYLASRVDQVAALFPWVEMVIFSELAAYGPSTARAEPLPGPGENAFQEMAEKHRLWIVTGSIYEKRKDGIYNTASVVDPSGRVVGRHRKLFPFLPYEKGVESGTEFLVFDVPAVGRFGVSICYDGWFPETTRTLVAMGAEVIVHPSLTGTVDRDVELAIARASAATNQCFFLDINGLGAGGVGRSILVGPDGDVLHEAGAGEELIPLELDLERVRRARERGLKTLGQPLKSFRDREVRFGVYDPRWKGGNDERYFDTLGPLKKPGRAARSTRARERRASS